VIAREPRLLTEEQEIRNEALGHAVYLEGQLPSALTLVPPREVTERMHAGEHLTSADADMLGQQGRLVEDATIDRVIRHARQLAAWITDGTAPELQRSEDLLAAAGILPGPPS
jgi:hypothetical protein